MRSWVRYTGIIAAAVAVVAAGCSSPPSGARQNTPSSVSSRTGTLGERTPSSAAATSDTTESLRGKVIVVDPGHNGGNADHPARINRQVHAGGPRKPCNTVGAQTQEGYPEHAFNWDVAERLTRLLEANGAEAARHEGRQRIARALAAGVTAYSRRA